VRAKNLDTGEFLDGPVWSFRTVDPATAVLDSFAFASVTGGWQLMSNRNSRSCTSPTLQIGPGYVTAMGWSLNALPADVKIADARIRIASFPGSQNLLPTVSCWSTRGPIDYCNMFDVQPVIDGHMGNARIVGTDLAVISNDALAAHVEATRRYSTFYGYRFTTPQQFSLIGPGGATDQRPVLYVRFYR
jgi:hypothetical protein